MPLINTAVPNLIQGVSQQPDSSRFDGQCEEQENALSSVADGLRKRPATQHVAKLLDEAITKDSFVHFINRDDDEKYVVIHTGTGIEAWNVVSGGKCLINGVFDPLTPPNYLATDNPRESLKALTVADNTFIVNKDVSVGLSQTKTAPLDKKGFVYIAQGDYEKKYQVNVGGNINGTVPSNQATFDIAVEGYHWYKGWEKFRVANVDITNRGSGYPATTPDILELSYNWGSLGSTVYASYTTINTEPVIQVTFEDDGTVDADGVSNGTKRVATATVVTVGQFAQHNAQVTGASFADNYSASITGTVAGDIIGGTEYSFSTVSDVDTKSYLADTTEIATSLFDDSAYPDDFAAQPFITADAAGNIFTSGTTFLNPPLTATREGGTIIIEHNNVDGDFTLTTEDGLAGNGIKAVYKRIDSLLDLPLKAPNNFVVEIVGDADLDQDNYWVRFTTNNGTAFGEGAWEEYVAPNVSDGLDASTMPMTIRSTNFNTLEIQTLDYAKRTAGDEDTNPNPSFVGQGINDIVFFKNRLGFITNETVVFSEAGEFFNFFRTTVSSLLDSAPIDITVSSTKVTKLKSATIFQENLMLFADNVQFVMKGGDLFTPKTVSISPTTNFSLDGDVSPIPIGSYIYFPFNRGDHTGLRELSLSANTETYDAVEVTEHVPSYIPSDIINMAGTTAEDIIVLQSGKEYSDGTNARNCLYIYNYFWNNNQKVLSAWSKFDFTGEIRGMEFIESSLYLVIAHHNQTQLVSMPLESKPSKITLSGYTTPDAPIVYAPSTPTVNTTTTTVTNDPNADTVDVDNPEEVIEEYEPSLVGGSNETSTFKLFTDKSVITEGELVTITLNTEGLSDGTVVSYTLSGDEVSNVNLGLGSVHDLTDSFTVTNNAASVLFDTNVDPNLHEENKVFTLSLDNGENSISVQIRDSNNFSVTLFEDQWSRVIFDPTAISVNAFDTLGNALGYVMRNAYPSNYREIPTQRTIAAVFDTFEKFNNPFVTGFKAVCSTAKVKQRIQTIDGVRSTYMAPIGANLQFIDLWFGGVVTQVHTATMNYTLEEMTGSWDVVLWSQAHRGWYGYVRETDIIPIAAGSSSITFPKVYNSAHSSTRVRFRLLSETGSINIKNVGFKLTRPLTAAESYARYGGYVINP